MEEDSKIIKIVLVGETGAGKSSIANRYVTNSFKPKQDSTIGVSFLSKSVLLENDKYPDGIQLKFQIWDTAGQERYRSLAKMYYRKAHAAILVYDITSRLSFTNLDHWTNELREKGPQDIINVFVGNKVDLDDNREVPYEEAKQYAEENGGIYIETSAKLNIGIIELFNDLGSKIELREEDDPNNIIIPNAPKEDIPCC